MSMAVSHKGRDVTMGGVGGVSPPIAHETAKKLVIKQIL